MSDANSARTKDPPAVVTQPVGKTLGNVSRRRLVLGAAAALPSVYTLSSGASAAVASNLRCFDAASTQPAPPRFTAADDTWYRSQVYDGKYKGSVAHCVSSPQTACAEAGQAKEGSIWVTDGGERISATSFGDKVTNVSAGPQSYGLVYVDQQGTISTLDNYNKTGLSYSSDSCWTSIMGGRISLLG